MSFSTLHVFACILLMALLSRCYGTSDCVSLTMHNPVNVTITDGCCNATNTSSAGGNTRLTQDLQEMRELLLSSGEDNVQASQERQQLRDLLNVLKSSLENGDYCHGGQTDSDGATAPPSGEGQPGEPPASGDASTTPPGEVCRCEFPAPGGGPAAPPVDVTHPRDCYDVQQKGGTDSGVYTIYPNEADPFEAFCDMDTDGGGWTVFQRRQDGATNFYWGWVPYRVGFGNPEAEFWMGNDRLYNLTNQVRDGNPSVYELRIDMVNGSGVALFMKYDEFRILGAADEYKLVTLRHFTGNTGFNYMAFHVMSRFSTFNNDNDRWSNRECAETYGGGWWYDGHGGCYGANLNGVYGSSGNNGIRLYNTGTRTYEHGILSFTEMKIRPAV